MGKAETEGEKMAWNGWINHDLEIGPPAAHLLV